MARPAVPWSRALWLAFGAVAAWATFSVALLAWQLAFATELRAGIAFGVLALALTLLALWTRGERATAALGRLADRLARVPRGPWLLGAVLVGLAIRIVWSARLPVPQLADAGAYFGLARSLVEDGVYRDALGRLAFWPPGLPLFLSLPLSVFGARPWVPTVANLALFAAAVPLVDSLARRVAPDGVARVAVALFVVWPNHVAFTGLATKELLLATLLPLALVAHLSDGRGSRAGLAVRAALAGVTLGLCVLTQPSWLLLPLVWFVQEWRRGQRLSRLAFALLGIVLVVGPWSVRNSRAFGAFVPLTTNGGDVFYRANNPRATGGYTERGELSLERLGELERSRAGYRLGREWIVDHPGSFLVLALRKQVLLLGDDSGGVFETVKRGRRTSGRPYVLAKAVANGYWWGLCVLMLLGAVRHAGSPVSRDPRIALLVSCLLYVIAVHSVFESGSRHHLPLAGPLAILAALAARDDRPA